MDHDEKDDKGIQQKQEQRRLSSDEQEQKSEEQVQCHDADGYHDQQHGQQKQEKAEKQGQNALSKKQLKKLQKKQKWEQIKREKRKQQREKQKQRKKEKAQQARQMQESVSEIQPKQKQKIQQNTKKRRQIYKQKMLDGQKVIIDLQFYDLMTDKQLTSLGKQIAYCHSLNRKADKCFNMILTSVTEPRMKYMNQKYQIGNFGINVIEQHFIDAFNKDKLVYLTGDADQELVGLDPDEIYIIGGIVDHNRLKQITINYAMQTGIKARRLPMEGVKLKASVHLAVNHVWEWMLKFYNGSTWKQAIKSVVPERKREKSNEKQKIEDNPNNIKSESQNNNKNQQSEKSEKDEN